MRGAFSGSLFLFFFEFNTGYTNSFAASTFSGGLALPSFLPRSNINKTSYIQFGINQLFKKFLRVDTGIFDLLLFKYI